MTQEEQNELLDNYEKLLAAHSEMCEKYNDYQAENLLLNENYENLRAEYLVVIKTVIKTLQAVGIWPVTDKIEVKTLVKTVSSLAATSGNALPSLRTSCRLQQNTGTLTLIH